MHSENKAAKAARPGLEAYGKKLLFVGLLIVTGIFCEWPDFHPEGFLNAGYHWWLDMIFHGGYYFAITILLYIVFCKGRSVGIFWIVVLLSSYLFEAMQAFVPGRSASVLDMISNLLGISLATIICTLFYRVRGKRKKRKMQHSAY
jgi:VanZ family protein